MSWWTVIVNAERDLLRALGLNPPPNETGYGGAPAIRAVLPAHVTEPTVTGDDPIVGPAFPWLSHWAVADRQSAHDAQAALGLDPKIGGMFVAMDGESGGNPAAWNALPAAGLIQLTKGAKLPGFDTDEKLREVTTWSPAQQFERVILPFYRRVFPHGAGSTQSGPAIRRLMFLPAVAHESDSYVLAVNDGSMGPNGETSADVIPGGLTRGAIYRSNFGFDSGAKKDKTTGQITGGKGYFTWADADASTARSASRVAPHGWIRVSGSIQKPSDPAMAGATEDHIQGVERRARIRERMSESGIPGVSVVVIEDGIIAWARSYGVTKVGSQHPVDASTIFQAASTSKPVSAMGALRLVQDSALSLDDDVNAYLDGWKLHGAKVTLRMLLSHTGGVSVHGFNGYAAGKPIPSVVQILNGSSPANSGPVRVERASGKVSYSGGGYVVVQKLVSDVTGLPFDEAMRRLVLAPLGMSHSTYAQPLPRNRWNNAASGHIHGREMPGHWHTYPEMAPAGLWTTPTDMAQFVIELMNAYTGKPSRVLDQATAATMLTPFHGRALGIVTRGKGASLRFQHGGSNVGYRSGIAGVPSTGQGAVVMTNADEGGKLAVEIVNAIAAEYGWPDPSAMAASDVSSDPEDPATAGAILMRNRQGDGPLSGTVDISFNSGETWSVAQSAQDSLARICTQENAARWPRLRAMMNYALTGDVPSKRRHAHTCSKCNHVWWHDPDACTGAGATEESCEIAHECENCGHVERWVDLALCGTEKKDDTVSDPRTSGMFDFVTNFFGGRKEVAVRCRDEIRPGSIVRTTRDASLHSHPSHESPVVARLEAGSNVRIERSVRRHRERWYRIGGDVAELAGGGIGGVVPGWLRCDALPEVGEFVVEDVGVEEEVIPGRTVDVTETEIIPGQKTVIEGGGAPIVTDVGTPGYVPSYVQEGGPIFGGSGFWGGGQPGGFGSPAPQPGAPFAPTPGSHPAGGSNGPLPPAVVRQPGATPTGPRTTAATPATQFPQHPTTVASAPGPTSSVPRTSHPSVPREPAAQPSTPKEPTRDPSHPLFQPKAPSGPFAPNQSVSTLHVQTAPPKTTTVHAAPPVAYVPPKSTATASVPKASTLTAHHDATVTPFPRSAHSAEHRTRGAGDAHMGAATSWDYFLCGGDCPEDGPIASGIPSDQTGAYDASMRAQYATQAGSERGVFIWRQPTGTWKPGQSLPASAVAVMNTRGHDPRVGAAQWPAGDPADDILRDPQMASAARGQSAADPIVVNSEADEFAWLDSTFGRGNWAWVASEKVHRFGDELDRIDIERDLFPPGEPDARPRGNRASYYFKLNQDPFMGAGLSVTPAFNFDDPTWVWINLPGGYKAQTTAEPLAINGIRQPMSFNDALSVAEAMNSILPTRAIVDARWAQAKNRTITNPVYSKDGAHFNDPKQNAAFAATLGPVGTVLREGGWKSMILDSVKPLAQGGPNSMVFYGWQKPGGGTWQHGISSDHDNLWIEYDSLVTMTNRDALGPDGQPVDLLEVIRKGGPVGGPIADWLYERLGGKPSPLASLAGGNV